MTADEYIGTGTGVFLRTYKPIFAGATPYHIPYWTSDQTLTLTGSVQVYGGQYVLINSGSPTPSAPEALLVQQINTSSVNCIGAYGSVNNFFQIYNQNFSSESLASTDIVATADVGNQDTNYIDMGINSSQYNVLDDPTQALDGYLMMNGGDLWIATLTDHSIRFIINSTASIGYIDSTGAHISGSFYGTASFSNSSSYVQGSSVYGQVSSSKTAETASYFNTIVYTLANYDISGSITYIGETSTTTNDWQISKMNTVLFTSSMASGTSDYATNWTNRYSLIYG